FLVYAIFLMVSRTFAGKIYDKKGHLYVFLPGTVLIFVDMLLLSWLPSTFVMLIAAALYGLGFGSVHTALQAWAVDQSPDNRKGRANASYFSSLDLGHGIVGMVFHKLASSYGF